MTTTTFHFQDGQWQGFDRIDQPADAYQLVLLFADRILLSNASVLEPVRQQFPQAQLVIGSTAGEIFQDRNMLNSIVGVAMQFDQTPIKTVCRNIAEFADSFDLGKNLAAELPVDGLKYVYLLSDGSRVNGSQLIHGINQGLPKGVLVTGGMAGDGDRFQTTVTGLNDQIGEGNVILVGFYGDRLLVGYGSRGGWLYLGPDRTITASTNNVLYEIDGEPALDLYKRYLGSFSDELPGSALLFPLALLQENPTDPPLVRTILSIDEANKSMVFAGDVPTGARVRLMRAGLQELVDAAGEASKEASTKHFKKPDFALAMNCVGRRLVLGHRADEEIESILSGLAPNTPMIGFYSYGEFSPMNHQGLTCDLHNQTVVLTIFEEN